MTDLQLSLIGAAGVFVAGVFTYNKWQEHKAKKSVERAFASDHDDVLMHGSAAPAASAALAATPRQEPSFGGAEQADADVRHAPAPAASDAAAGASDPAADGAERAAAAPHDVPDQPVADEAAASAERASLAEQATQLVDPLIDCLLPLALEAPVRGDKILPVLQTLRMVGNKPLHYIGLHVNGDWEPITHGGVYTKLQGGVQLASRGAALNEIEYSELVTRLRVVADEIGAEPELPNMIDVMAEARALHRFIAGHDAQLGVNLRSNGAPWPIATLLGALEAQGLDVRPDGRCAMPDGAGAPLFTLSTNVALAASATPRLTLLLDVPCVAPARAPFAAMLACARALVGRLDATIVDDYEQPLSEAALDEIAGQVREFYQEMDAADIPAGSARALRLFS